MFRRYRRPVWFALDVLAYAALGVLAVALGIFVRRKFSDDSAGRFACRVVVRTGSLAVLLAVLVLAGQGAGVK